MDELKLDRKSPNVLYVGDVIATDTRIVRVVKVPTGEETRPEFEVLRYAE